MANIQSRTFFSVTYWSIEVQVEMYSSEVKLKQVDMDDIEPKERERERMYCKENKT